MDIKKVSDTKISVSVDAVIISLTEARRRLTEAQKKYENIQTQLPKLLAEITRLENVVAEAVRLGVKEDPRIDFTALRNLKKGA